MQSKIQPSAQYLPSFARRQGRGVKEHQKKSIREHLHKYLIPDKTEKIKEIFDRYAKISLEIGFGRGKYLAKLTEFEPEILHIGAEPYMAGVASLMGDISDNLPENLLVFTDDARILLERLPDDSLDRTYILFPDPWPKLRHHKRRIIQKPLLDLLAIKMKKGSLLLIATDHYEYCEYILEMMLRDDRFVWQADACQDFCSPPPFWAGTRYHDKGLREGRNPSFLRFIVHEVCECTIQDLPKARIARR